jgi:DNA-binding winged helix-turn-helix (wHTH) protein/TolB-like protein
MQHRPPFNLGKFRVDPEARTVSTASGEIHLEPKVMAVLVLLAEHANEVVAREEFIAAVWPREFSGDEGLTRAISQLRKVFGKASDGPVAIETIPRTGYRLQVHDQPRRSETTGNRAWLRWLAAAAVLLAVVAVVYLRGSEDLAPPAPEDDRRIDSPVAVPGASEKATERAAGDSVVLAVLPFESAGGAPGDASLALGLGNEMLSKLSRSAAIAAITGSSSSQFKGTSRQDLEALARQFRVSHVIEGRLRRNETGLQVDIRLLDTRNGEVIWSEAVRRAESDIYRIPGELAGAVHAALGAGPLPARTDPVPPAPSAYEAYLQARALTRSASGENLQEAIRLLEQAVSRDPDLAEAWAALAWARLDRAHLETSTEIGEPDTLDNWQAARLDANRALALDAGSIDALLLLIILDLMEREDTLVETESRVWSLLDRAPNHPNANYRMGIQMMSVGRWEESLRYVGRALQLDPLSTLTRFYYATALLGSERNEEFLDLLRRAGTETSWRRSWPWLIFQLVAGDYDSARGFFSILQEDNVFYLRGLGLSEIVDPTTPRGAALLDLVDRLVRAAETGARSGDNALAADLLRAAEEDLIPDHWVAQLLGAAGLDDATFQLARERIARGDIWYRELLMMPAFRSLRSDPAVMELFAASGQLDYWLQTGHWPDYCADPELPYDCEAAGRAYRGTSASQ